jgi:hypothetical protein
MLIVIDNAPQLVSALFASSTLANSSTSIFQSEELSVPVSKLQIVLSFISRADPFSPPTAACSSYH